MPPVPPRVATNGAAPGPPRPWDAPWRAARTLGEWNPLRPVESVLKRDEADVVLVAGNVVLVALEIIEWPVAVLTLAVHLIARSRFKGLEAAAEVAEEVED